MGPPLLERGWGQGDPGAPAPPRGFPVSCLPPLPSPQKPPLGAVGALLTGQLAVSFPALSPPELASRQWHMPQSAGQEVRCPGMLERIRGKRRRAERGKKERASFLEMFLFGLCMSPISSLGRAFSISQGFEFQQSREHPIAEAGCLKLKVSSLHCKDSSGSQIVDLELKQTWPVAEVPGQKHFGKCASLAGAAQGG